MLFILGMLLLHLALYILIVVYLNHLSNRVRELEGKIDNANRRDI